MPTSGWSDAARNSARFTLTKIRSNPPRLKMPDQKSPTPATDAVKALARFLHEPEIEDEPREQIQAELKNAGIDTAAVIKTVREKIDQAKSRRRLAAARERRQSLLWQVTRLTT